MTGPLVVSKWRPSLGLIVFSVLLSVLALPAGIIIWFRLFSTEVADFGKEELGALVAAFLLTLMIAFVLTRTITGPINALIARTHDIARGGRAAIRPLDTYGTSEIANLSQDVLDLASRLVERTEYTRSFAAHVSHELKSPLTSIKGAAELLLDDDPSHPMSMAERRRFLSNIVADADRLSALLARLRELAEAEVPIGGGTTTLAAIAERLSQRFPQLRVVVRGSAALALSSEAATIIFSHLAENSAQHGASTLTLAAEPGLVRVSDDGPGISPGNRDRIFSPFFSTRREQGGTGMGLDIVRATLVALGGAIVLEEGGSGASFIISLPTDGAMEPS